MGHQITTCPVANALVQPGLTAIFKNMPYCCTETYLRIYRHLHTQSLYSCLYKYNNSHNSSYFALDKGFSENKSNRYNKYTFY